MFPSVWRADRIIALEAVIPARYRRGRRKDDISTLAPVGQVVQTDSQVLQQPFVAAYLASFSGAE